MLQGEAFLPGNSEAIKSLQKTMPLTSYHWTEPIYALGRLAMGASC
jgi:hypothetical protein